MFKKFNVKVGSSNIEDCHWLPSKGPKRVIVKFSNQKDTDRVWKVKKSLKGIDVSSIGTRSPVNIKDSLCKYYKMLGRKCKKTVVSLFICFGFQTDPSD